jgi:hypothetical protein
MFGFDYLLVTQNYGSHKALTGLTMPFLYPDLRDSDLIGGPGPYPVEPAVRACSGKFTTTEKLSPDFRIGVCTQEPAHRFAGESIIGPKVRNFLSNEDTGKHRTSVRACFELAPGFFIWSTGFGALNAKESCLVIEFS